MANLIESRPELEVLGVGAQDPLVRIHAPNESIDLEELKDPSLPKVVPRRVRSTRAQ